MPKPANRGMARRDFLKAAAAAAGGAAVARARQPAGGNAGPKTGPPASAPSQDLAPDSIVGRAVYDGTPPEPEAVDCSADPYCANLYRNEPLTREFVVVSQDRRLKNVFVSVKKGLPENSKWPAPAKPAVLEENCRFEPHVFGVVAGQPLDLVNASRTFEAPRGHPKRNQEFSFNLPRKGMKGRVVLTRPEAFRIKCDVHPWELAWCHVVPHPFFAVSDAEGNFAIKGLSPGEYELEFWHEQLGAQTRKVRIEAGNPARIEDVKFKPGQKRRTRKARP